MGDYDVEMLQSEVAGRQIVNDQLENRIAELERRNALQKSTIEEERGEMIDLEKEIALHKKIAAVLRAELVEANAHLENLGHEELDKYSKAVQQEQKRFKEICKNVLLDQDGEMLGHDFVVDPAVAAVEALRNAYDEIVDRIKVVNDE